MGYVPTEWVVFGVEVFNMFKQQELMFLVLKQINLRKVDAVLSVGNWVGFSSRLGKKNSNFTL